MRLQVVDTGFERRRETMNKVPPWKRLLQRKTDEHFALFHSKGKNFTRRGFLTTATAAAGLAVASDFALAPRARAAENGAEPKPIPGGGSLLGVSIHHNPLPADSRPLTEINDPSEIGDFNGMIIDTQIRGLGTGTGLDGPQSFRADMGAMQGVYVGEDGKHHHGSFVFI
jgi:hypothetical protein